MKVNCFGNFIAFFHKYTLTCVNLQCNFLDWRWPPLPTLFPFGSRGVPSRTDTKTLVWCLVLSHLVYSWILFSCLRLSCHSTIDSCSYFAHLIIGMKWDDGDDDISRSKIVEWSSRVFIGYRKSMARRKHSYYLNIKFFLPMMMMVAVMVNNVKNGYNYGFQWQKLSQLIFLDRSISELHSANDASNTLITVCTSNWNIFMLFLFSQFAEKPEDKILQSVNFLVRERERLTEL